MGVKFYTHKITACPACYSIVSRILQTHEQYYFLINYMAETLSSWYVCKTCKIGRNSLGYSISHQVKIRCFNQSKFITRAHNFQSYLSHSHTYLNFLRCQMAFLQPWTEISDVSSRGQIRRVSRAFINKFLRDLHFKGKCITIRLDCSILKLDGTEKKSGPLEIKKLN